MIITNNGSIEGTPHTSMLKRQSDGVWLHLLVCKVAIENSDEDLAALFATDTVEDDTIGVKWDYTEFLRVENDGAHKFVWLTYTAQQAAADQYAEALNILGVETEVAENEEV